MSVHLPTAIAPRVAEYISYAQFSGSTSDLRTVDKRKRLNRNHVRYALSAFIPTLIIVVVIAAALFPTLFTHQDPAAENSKALLSPSANHWFGTDSLGRDLYARVIYASSHSLSAAVIAVCIGAFFGSLIGIVAGSKKGKIDSLLMRFTDVLLSIPTLLLSLSVVILLGFGVANAAIAVGVSVIASFARLSRSQTVRVCASDYVASAYGAGGNFGQVVIRHVLPNSFAEISALATLQLGSAILAISSLGFLGYGAQPPTPEWGLIIAEGRDYIATSPWLTLFPGIVLSAIVLSSNRLSKLIHTHNS